jgi:hypothetical protein
MDLGAAAVIVGIVAGVVGIIAGVIYIVETACKYGPVLLKKATTFKNLKTCATRERDFLSPKGTSFTVSKILRDLAVTPPEVRALLLKKTFCIELKT